MKKFVWLLLFTFTAAPAALRAQDEETVPAAPLADGAQEVVKELSIGDAAPAISIADWTKGEAITAFAPDTVYVVEFWATWCGPCRTSMPHISSLQKEYGKKVRFIGVSDEDAETVGKFMKSEVEEGKTWNDVITYSIALDDKEQTSAAYMRAAGQNGIPTAFVVGRSGKVEWIGHPMSIDEPLAEIVEGKWDLEKARKEFIAERETERAMQAAIPKLQKAMAEEDYDGAIAVIDELLTQFPDNQQMPMIKFQILARSGQKEKIVEHVQNLLTSFGDDARMLNQIAWVMAVGVPKESTDLDLAMKVARRASELTEDKDGSTLDTIARIYSQQGNLEEAIAWQKRAIAAEPAADQLKETLDEYETALKNKIEKKDAPAKPE